jgi:hypothetical protein
MKESMKMRERKTEKQWSSFLFTPSSSQRNYYFCCTELATPAKNPNPSTQIPTREDRQGRHLLFLFACLLYSLRSSEDYQEIDSESNSDSSYSSNNRCSHQVCMCAKTREQFAFFHMTARSLRSVHFYPRQEIACTTSYFLVGFNEQKSDQYNF